MENQGGSVLANEQAAEAEAAPQHRSHPTQTEPSPEPRYELTSNVERTLDPKGRLVIPAQVRPWFDAGVFILPWPGPSVALIPTAQFKKMERRLRKKQREAISDPNAHLALTALATQAYPDSQGRIFIPEPARRLGRIAEELLVVGRMNRLELWTPGSFRAKETELLSALEAQIYLEAL